MINSSLHNYSESVEIDVSSAAQEFATGQTLRGILVLAAGDLDVTDVSGHRDVYTFPSAANGGCYPFVLPLQVKKIWNTTTTISSALLIGLRG